MTTRPPCWAYMLGKFYLNLGSFVSCMIGGIASTLHQSKNSTFQSSSICKGTWAGLEEALLRSTIPSLMMVETPKLLVQCQEEALRASL